MYIIQGEKKLSNDQNKNGCRMVAFILYKRTVVQRELIYIQQQQQQQQQIVVVIKIENYIRIHIIKIKEGKYYY